LAPDNRHAYAIYMGLAVLAASLAVHLVRKEGRNRRLGVAALVLWGLLLAGFAARASLNARTAAQLSRKIVAQSAALLDGGGAPIRFVALTVPDSYRGAFVLRNGLHQALRLVRPDRQVQALSCTLIGINDLTVPGIGITAQDGASYTVQILPGRNAYILLPIALWTRRTGESITIGPVTYRIVEKEGLFQVTKIHMRFEERFVDQLGVVLAAFVGGNMTLFDKPK
jgi:hypothetical protein